MKKLILLLSLFQMSCGYETASHSLWMKSTYIKGRTPFPEFSAYMMLDDIVFGYYDSNKHKLLYTFIHKALNSSVDEDEMDYVGSIIGYVHGRLKDRASYLSKYFNHTNEIYTYQRAAGCELLGDDKPGLMISTDAYNGETVEGKYFDVDHEALHFNRKWTNSESALWTPKLNGPSMYKFVYQPNCIKFLKKHLAKDRNRVLKKVKPRVRLLQSEKKGSTGVLLTCLATGFYPRHINLTLLRDGQSVSDHQITGGELLPNGDETYQMRKSLEVSAEELQHHHYTCTAEHLSLDNKLDIDLAEGDWDLGTTAIASSTLVAVCVCCLVGATGFFIRKKTTKDKDSQTAVSSNYSAASSTDDSEKAEEVYPLNSVCPPM
ncbi:hypothetical protein AALO_G00073410 [Alosa alosa]|uniref:Ig-like domain-containing protein n=1 Tax=Alosa alosa TaxID=278164 RepID=A0AAV6H2L5_9TELE|nr:major histocompatibility complex class I-related gene protein-like isoform X2 [Alosa alosa]KAG5281539.1 hypothetical protein AALO_G00073410 [Alosa alosa]